MHQRHVRDETLKNVSIMYTINHVFKSIFKKKIVNFTRISSSLPVHNIKSENQNKMFVYIEIFWLT